jgi:2,3-bisphosphoglycerate-independent phosphoglycerate mutase
MNSLPRPRPLVVVVLDGWGISQLHEGNAPMVAETPTLDHAARFFPATSLAAAGAEVGLGWNQPGNSEAGHRSIGAGRPHYQIMTLIDRAIANGSFFTNPVFLNTIKHVQRHKSRLHVIGLLSPGGIHSHMHHLFALLKLFSRYNLKNRVFLHMITDGADTPSQSAPAYIDALEVHMKRWHIGEIASITGRLYAMDRNRNWHRTQHFYRTVTGNRHSQQFPSARAAAEHWYRQRLTDEVIPPSLVGPEETSQGFIRDDDAILFFNFRPDRMRQIVQAFAEPDFTAFPRTTMRSIAVAGMAPYDPALQLPAAFEEVRLPTSLAHVLSEHHVRQLHIAETEKYAHVTYYLNVGQEKKFPQEEHSLVRSSSPKNFSVRPHMAADEITQTVLRSMERDPFDVYFINYANADMIGHSGIMAEVVRAAAFLDQSLYRLMTAAANLDGAMIITADHGNAEQMINPFTLESQREHTVHPVPFYFIHRSLQREMARTPEEIRAIMAEPIGILADVAPTILDILHLPQPPTMNGISLLPSLC